MSGELVPLTPSTLTSHSLPHTSFSLHIPQSHSFTSPPSLTSPSLPPSPLPPSLTSPSLLHLSLPPSLLPPSLTSPSLLHLSLPLNSPHSHLPHLSSLCKSSLASRSVFMENTVVVKRTHMSNLMETKSTAATGPTIIPTERPDAGVRTYVA